VELPQGQTILYDAGSMSAPESTARTIAGFLWSRRITHLDAVLLSHADADHYNALPELLKRFSVGVVVVTPRMFENETPALQALRDAIGERGIAMVPSYAGDRLKVRDASGWLVLHPPPGGVVGSDNANSLVLRADYAARRILLTGDLEPPGLDDVLASPPVACDVALAPHHGSPRSRPEEFVAWCQPKWLVISGAANEGYAAYQAAATVPGGRALNTGRCGAVQVTVGQGRFEVRAWCRDPW
jgi:competence protein ComEC